MRFISPRECGSRLPPKYATAIIAAGCLALAACSQPTGSKGADTASEAQAQASVAVTSFSVEHGASANEYLLQWVTDEPGAPVRLEVSSGPDTADAVVIARDITAGEFQWTAPPPPRRRYFSVVPASGDAVQGAVRLLPLEGGRNFRDLGGYVTEDGRRVRWGRVYRSGVMTNLTAGDYEYLAGLDIATVCDYRSEQERHEEPTRWAAGQVDYVTFPDPATPAGSSFMGVLRKPDATPQMAADAMAAGYAQLARDHAGAFGTMFDRLASGEIPLAFNCSAGKDRAGISAALLLSALGVPRATVVADYALSEQFVDYIAEFRGGAADEPAEEGGAYAFLDALPLEILTPLMRSDPRYIEYVLSWMDKEYGSVMHFIHEELDVTGAELSAIRAALLE